VALAARRLAELERVAADIRAAGGTALAVPTDARDEATLRALVARTEQELGPIDILANCAGISISQEIHALAMPQWDEVMVVNLRAPALLCASVLQGMRRRGYGRIVNVASEAGVLVYAGMGAYAVSKHGLRVLTELIQEENQELGIKAWAICPGMVDTPMGAGSEGANLRNFLTVDQVVDVVRYLLHQDENVKLGPEILIRTQRNPFGS